MAGPSEQGLPPYARIVEDVRARIAAGDLAPGDRVPSTRAITREWGVAMATATKALAALRQEGLVEAVRGVGTVVRGASTADHDREDGAAAVETGRPSPSRAAFAGRRGADATPLTREAVVRAAIAVADAEGIDELSMRRVARELGVSTMALYRHVAGKEELATAMIDAIYLDVDLPELPPEDWRRALELAMRWEFGVYRRHSWALRLTPVAGPALSPALMRNGEWMMRAITANGSSPDAALAVLTIVSAYTSGMAMQAGQAVVHEDELGVDAEHWWRSRASEFADLAAEGAYPVMFSVSGPPDIDAIFEPGMQRLLDGLAPLIDQAADARSPGCEV